MQIQTARTRLRLLIADDLDALVELDSDAQVMRYISGGPATPREVYTDHLLPHMLACAQTNPGMGFFAIEDHARAFLGWAHLRPETEDASWAEVGYRIKRALWGQGLATEVAAALIAHSFDTLNRGAVSARCMPDNLGSRRVLEKCGLRAAGTCEFLAREFGSWRMPAAPGLFYLRLK